jgi:hypothetical protein
VPVPIVLPGGTEGGGITRRVYRRDIADHIGEYALAIVSDQASASAAVEPERWVFCTALQSDGLDFTRLDGFWLYVATGAQAGQVRRVLEGQYYGDIGGLQVDRPFDDVLANETEVELTDSLPGGRAGTVKGINEALNEGMSDTLIETRLPLNGNGTRSISLVDYSDYIELGDQINGVYDTRWDGSAITGTYELSGYGARVQTDGGTLTLVTDYTYTDGTAFQAGVLRRGDTLVRTGGTWGASTTGLQSDSDAAAVPLRWGRAFGCRRAIEHMLLLTEKDKALDEQTRARKLARLELQRARWAKAASLIAQYQFPQLQSKPRTPMVGLARTDVRGWP